MPYQRGKEKTWWYRFRFGGRIVHESSKSQSLTVAREAERQRRRELEEKWNHIQKRTLPPTFEKAANEWQAGREGRFAPSTLNIGRVSIMHLTPQFGEKLLCDITHCAIIKLAESQASDQTIMSIAGHVSRAMLEHYNHIRMAAKRVALDAISTPLPESPAGGKLADFSEDVHQNCNQTGNAQNGGASKLLN
jgi:hypothetical protein